MDVTIAIMNHTSLVLELGQCYLENAQWRAGVGLDEGDVLSPDAWTIGRFRTTQPGGPWSALLLIPYAGEGTAWEVLRRSMQVSFGFEPAGPPAGEPARFWKAGDETNRFIVQPTLFMINGALWVMIVIRDKWAVRRAREQPGYLGRDWRDPPSGGAPIAVA